MMCIHPKDTAVDYYEDAKAPLSTTASDDRAMSYINEEMPDYNPAVPWDGLVELLNELGIGPDQRNF